ncbi:MAG TPA: hypothetical protein VHH73_01380 [Verrucomicrobiae bacterium]|nr:hypothetical protein [Verrucomicrobiae bacterium]
MPAPRVIHLRELLSEKFPGLRTIAGEPALPAQNRWATGLAQMDDATGGGLAKGALTEIVAPGRGSGGALLTHALLDQAGRENQIIAVVDGSDSLDVTSLSEATLARLLWVRCGGADQALKAADFLLRDNNFSLLVLDLAANPAGQLRRISATTWYRFQRLLEKTATVCAVFTPHAMVAAAQDRLTLRAQFPIESLDSLTSELLPEIKVEAAGERQFRVLGGEKSA